MHTKILNKNIHQVMQIQYRHKLQKQISTEQKQAKNKRLMHLSITTKNNKIIKISKKYKKLEIKIEMSSACTALAWVAVPCVNCVLKMF